MDPLTTNHHTRGAPATLGTDPGAGAALCPPAVGPQARQVTSRAGGAVVLVLLLASVAGLFFPLFRHLNTGVTASDYPYHAMFAEEIRRTKKKTVPHFLFHEVLIVVKRVQEAVTGVRPYVHRPTQPPLPQIVAQYATAMAVTCLLFTELLAVLVWASMRGALCAAGAGGVAASAWAALLALTLLLVAPVALGDHYYYLGYIGTNVWHSPTMLAVKPTALLTFWCVLGAFAASRASDPGRPPLANRLGFCAVLAALVVLSALAKPNWVMCLIPAAGLLALAWDLGGRRVDWPVLLLGMVAPAGLVLFWQFRLTYVLGQAGGGITIAPLRVMSGYANHLGTKFVLSVLFPVGVYVLYFREARTSLRLNLSWLAFLVGASFTYLVAEKKRVLDGNFTWGAQVALFVLFVESVVLVVRAAPVTAAGRPAPGRTRWVALAGCGAAYLAHFVSGAWYYLHLMRTDPTVPGFFS